MTDMGRDVTPPPEPCENCGAPVRPTQLYLGETLSRMGLLERTVEASAATDWRETWVWHTPERCRVTRQLTRPINP